MTRRMFASLLSLPFLRRFQKPPVITTTSNAPLILADIIDEAVLKAMSQPGWGMKYWQVTDDYKWQGLGRYTPISQKDYRVPLATRREGFWDDVTRADNGKVPYDPS